MSSRTERARLIAEINAAVQNAGHDPQTARVQIAQPTGVSVYCDSQTAIPIVRDCLVAANIALEHVTFRVPIAPAFIENQ